MNSYNCIGNITQDLELRSTSSGKNVCEFSIAINEGYGENQRTIYPTIVVWGVQAENLTKYCSKGSKVGISGSLRIDKYQNDKGENRYKTFILASHIEFLDSKKSTTPEDKPVVDSKPEPVEDPYKDFGEQVELTDDDYPF